MTIGTLLVASVLVFSCLAGAQAPTGSPTRSNEGRTLQVLSRARWSHIGSPPSEASSAAGRLEWNRESAAFTEGLEALRHSWTGEPVNSAADLRIAVEQYEDLVRNVTEAGGYGNLVLADAARRLSTALLVRYVVTNPTEYAVVSDILSNNRVKLLDCTAVGDMLNEELRITPPSSRWHLSESRAEIELVFKKAGANYGDESWRFLVGRPEISKLVTRRDISGLLIRLIGDEKQDRVALAGLIEFLKRGGSPEDLLTGEAAPLLRVMKDEIWKYRFPPMGITMLGGEPGSLIEWTKRWAGKAIPFSVVVEVE